MKPNQKVRLTIAVLLSFVALTIFSEAAAAQSAKVQGIINARIGPTMTLQLNGGGNQVVVLTDSTQVEDVSGIFHARRKQMGLTALTPGLSVEVQGNYNAQNQLVAETVKFNANALKTAVDIQAGVAPEQQAEQQQQQQIAEQQQKLHQQQAQLNQERQQEAAEAAKIAANKAAIAAVNKRFGELTDYNIWDEVTVYFGNGQVAIDSQYKPKLLALCQKAKTVSGYVIQVKGYASAVGSAALNQKLSQERAANVVDFLEQQGGIPLTNMLAPGAMGTSKQVAPDSTVEGQAENRRVIVRVLQNKGIAGS